jgi:hypothetical protein
MASAIQSACRAAVEGFADTAPNVKREVYADTLAVILSFLFALFVLAFVGKLLWNNVVVDLFSFAKPAKSFWQIIGLMIFMSLIRP